MFFLKRILYFGYYIKKTDWAKFWLQLEEAKRLSKRNRLMILADILHSSFKYNISILEYFYFRFYNNKDTHYRSSYAGTGYMYETIQLFNPRKYRYILEDKIYFLKHYAPFVKHKFVDIDNLINNSVSYEDFITNSNKKIVLKNSHGQCGEGVEVRNRSDFDKSTLISHLKHTKNDYVEEFIEQHADLSRLSPSGLNTLRIITQINKNGDVDILGCRLRISINSQVDNLAAGNMAAYVNEETGIVEGPGVFSDITKDDLEVHPITGEKILGFKVPFFKESIEMVKNAANFDTRNTSIGWDVAITNSGPELIEANHDWCKLLWQLPVKKGLKHVLESYK